MFLMLLRDRRVKEANCSLAQICFGFDGFDEHVLKGGVGGDDHTEQGSPSGLSQNMPPSQITMPTDGTVTFRSGYIVSGILLFVHFWGFVYTCQQPV